MSDWVTPERREEIQRWINQYRPAMPAIVGWGALGALLGAMLSNVVQAGFFYPAYSYLLTTAIAAYIAFEFVLHRMGWWGRRIQPRMWLWWVVAGTLIAAAIVLVLKASGPEFDYISAARHSNNFDSLAMLLTFPAVKAAVFRLYLNALALTACGGLAYLSPSPRRWASFDRFRLFLLALITLVGRPATGDLYDYLATLQPGPGLDLSRIILAPIVMPFFGSLILATFALIIGAFVILLFMIFVSLPLVIFDLLNERDIQAQIRSQKIAGLEGYLWRFDAWLRHAPLLALPDDSKGARFSTKEEVEVARLPFGFAFGHIEGKPLFLNTDKHVLLMASTRSGKGVTIIIPHLLRYEGSAFVLDPKGENARATGRWRDVLNDTVHYLDPFGISGKPRSRFNPLAFFTPENMEASSKAVAAALILDAKRDHWTASGQQLLAGVILHVVTSDSYPPETKDLVTVRRLVLGAMKETLEEMRTNEAAGGLVADLAASFLSTPEKEFGSIASTVQRETEILDNPYIAACLSAAGDDPEVDFRVWHRSTMSVFLCLSAPKFPIFNRWLRLVLTSALDEMTDQLDPPEKPVCFMLDELATLGHLAAIENAVGLAAGYGVQLVTVFQDISQMKDLYKGRWASFIGNAGIRALFSLDDYETAKYWSDFMGGRLVGTLSQSQDIYGITQGKNAGETIHSLLTPEELMLRYASGKMLVLKQGQRPVESDRVPYWLDTGLATLWDDPRARP